MVTLVRLSLYTLFTLGLAWTLARAYIFYCQLIDTPMDASTTLLLLWVLKNTCYRHQSTLHPEPVTLTCKQRAHEDLRDLIVIHMDASTTLL